MIHFDIYNVSYGQNKGRESREVGNRRDSLACNWRVTRRWKTLDEGYNFGLDLVLIESLHHKL